MSSSEWEVSINKECPYCNTKGNVLYRIVTSSDEAYEDINYFCKSCSKDWWVDGCDS